MEQKRTNLVTDVKLTTLLQRVKAARLKQCWEKFWFFFFELSSCWCVWERRRLQSARGIWTKIYKHGTKENEFSQWCDTDNSTATRISSKTKTIIQHNTWIYPLNLGIKWWDNCWNLNKSDHSTKLSFFFYEPFYQTIINWERNLVHMIPVYAISLPFKIYNVKVQRLKNSESLTAIQHRETSNWWF